MSALFIDTETTKKPLHDPFNPLAKLCYIGADDAANYFDYSIEYDELPCVSRLLEFQEHIDRAAILVGANFKFDLHWLRRYGIKFHDKRIWDVLLVQYILNHQLTPHMSLNEVAEQWGLGQKEDVVKTEYWERSCSCCAGIVEKILSIGLKDCVVPAIKKSMMQDDQVEQEKRGCGEQPIQKKIGLQLNVDVRNYVLTLRQRIEQNEQSLKTHTRLQMLSWIDSWLLQNALFAEAHKEWLSTTITQQEKLEADYVEHVTRLWDILKSESGWQQHSNTCSPTPVETTEIPEPVLQSYLKQDVQLTKQIYFLQLEEVKKRNIMPLIVLHNQDLLMLEEMEYQGNLYDVALSEAKAEEKEKEIAHIIELLNQLSPIVPKCWSPDFLSLLLYGGTYKYVCKEPYIFTYKDGSTREKTHNVVHEVILDRLTEPPKIARAKEGFWPTDEATLKKLKTKGTAKSIVKLLLRLREIEKLNGTYLRGFPSKIHDAEWEGNLIHTNYSQVTAVTGRLSSSKPNMQNNPAEQKDCFISRYE